jgi:hypothetical protein
MNLGRLRLPSFRGRKLPSPRGIALIVVGALVAGIGAGWFIAHLTVHLVRGDPVASPSASLSPSSSVTHEPSFPSDLYPAIDRPIDAADTYAGLASLEIPLVGPGTFTVTPGLVEAPGTGPLRWVRVEVEDGLPISGDAAAIFVLSTLNDERGWGANGRMTFARTDGAADIIVVFASPSSMNALCTDSHSAAPPRGEETAPVVEATEDTTMATASQAPVASPSPNLTVRSCAEQGLVIINAYLWAAGLESFGDERQSARQYLINHYVGHILEQADTTCPAPDELASVMQDQEIDVAPCRPNAWPHPLTE